MPQSLFLFTGVRQIVARCCNKSTIMQGNRWLFFSQTFSRTQRHYSTFNRELLTIYLAIRNFCYFVDGRQFTVYTDHDPLYHTFSLIHIIHPHNNFVIQILSLNLQAMCSTLKRKIIWFPIVCLVRLGRFLGNSQRRIFSLGSSPR